jgi:uncharacterized protein YjiS (DUF1127 family)
MNDTVETRSSSMLTAIFASWWKAHRAGKNQRRLVRWTRAELSQLDNHILRDIGLTRGEIPSFIPDDFKGRWG